MASLIGHEVSYIEHGGSFRKSEDFLENVRDIKGICLPRASGRL